MSKSIDETPVATLMPLDNWHRIYRMTAETVTKDVHRGTILGAEVERRWDDIDKTFEVKHPDFTVVIEAAELQYLSRERRNGDQQQVSCMLTGDFDAYDNFQVLLKMVGDDDPGDQEDY